MYGGTKGRRKDGYVVDIEEECEDDEKERAVIPYRMPLHYAASIYRTT